MSDTQQSLEGTSVGILIAERGTEEIEFTEPKRAVSDAGATVSVLGTDTGEARTVNNDLEASDSYAVDETVSEASASEYDALIVPGGAVGADILRSNADVVELLREHEAAGKPIGVICHGPWTLVEADVVDGRTVTSYPSLRTDIENAGGEWVDEEVVIDDGLITSRDPDDLPAFCDAIVEEFEAESS
ncbi:type 1 glutamine amidotransferase domain-containing protein [Halostagnicola kamekurae]|uniref:Protease I n=1 Tax=Halostagnicola kamekurae TaxID=619731 RepID=A0A1I6UIG9_9EURY|nr:type 1 glutamine amidotransferase domain-containing protein [Halostagnicola kamekurae]SFT01077.1 protease I [Halostagnicola kamekurae]